MENASKALIIAASVLIAVMLMSFMVFMFRRFKTIAKDTETNLSELEIDAFNSRFIGYETGGTHSTSDTFNIIKVRSTSSGASTPITIQFGTLFGNTGSYGASHNKALVAASQSLNTASNVVTAINDAIDTNYTNSNSYLYGYVESQNSVEIIVDLNGYTSDAQVQKFNKGYRYLVIEPNQNVKAKTVYGFNGLDLSGDNTSKRLNRIESLKNQFNDSNSINAYDILENLRETMPMTMDGRNYTVYRYYFFGQVFKNESTHLVETVKFTLVKNNGF